MVRLRAQIDEYNWTRRVRGEPEMTQRRLADLTGVNEVTVHRHATEQTGMSLLQALAYAQALRCRPEDLADGSELDA